MATVDHLKQALRQSAGPAERQPLSDAQYSAGLAIVAGDADSATYQDFIVPQLSALLASLTDSHGHVSVLEVGPGPRSVLGHLPDGLRRKIRRYVALEPNVLFAARLEAWLRPSSETPSPLPRLRGPPEIHRTAWGPRTVTEDLGEGEKFDVVLFCHSMYGMKPRKESVEMALELLVPAPEGGIVVVFHRYGSLGLDGLASQRTATYPTGLLRVADDDEALGRLAPFIAGFHGGPSAAADEALQAEWRAVCRALGRREPAHPACLEFSAPEVMVAFTRHATALAELTAQVPVVKGTGHVKNREARLHQPAAVVQPTDVDQVQTCVRWALKHGLSLTVLAGGHSGQCLWPNVVAVDMSHFSQIHMVAADEDGETSAPWLVAETGCKTGDIIRAAGAAGRTVPLGARPSVGAGLWLQGGIGHLARLHGLACDAVVGAVMVSVGSGELFCVGRVPGRHRPAGAERLDEADEADILWALRGAGTNYGIVVSVTFKTYPAPSYVVRSRVESLADTAEAQRKLRRFDQELASTLPRTCSADAYLYGDHGELKLGITTFETCPTEPSCERPDPLPPAALMGQEWSTTRVDGVGLFDCDMYMSGMHGGHGGGKTSSFKRCLFLKHVGSAAVSQTLAAAVASRPSPLCYLHLLHGGGAIGDTTARATAFGVRDWDFACVVTGVWPRAEDGTAVARAGARWVYDVAAALLPLSAGAYAADLGPDPRDAALAARAFGPNRARLGRLKRRLDPRRVLARACPLLPEGAGAPKLIVLVTGACGAGKDFCARVWAAALAGYPGRQLAVRVARISDGTKREYAAATGADMARLLGDRAYKEQHRPALTAFFQHQREQRPDLPKEHFLEVVYDAGEVDVLLITGLRDEAPLADLSPLVPYSRLLDVRIRASLETRAARRGCHGAEGERSEDDEGYCPSLVFDNDVEGEEAAARFARTRLWPFWHEDLQRLAGMVRTVPDFPRAGIAFRDVLGIAEQAGGLALCASLLQRHYDVYLGFGGGGSSNDGGGGGGGGCWAKVGVVACCEAGGFLVAPALAARVGVPLALIRDAGKRPPPAVSVLKPPSHISYSSAAGDEGAPLRAKTMEMGRDVVVSRDNGGGGAPAVVVVDDALASGTTLCAVLQLLAKAGTRPEDVSVLVVAEFPAHGGRALLRAHGFGRVRVHSLLVYDGQ